MEALRKRGRNVITKCWVTLCLKSSLSSQLLLNGKTLLFIVVMVVVGYITVIATGVSPISS